MDAGQFLSIFISAVFIYNVILSRFLGLCSFIAISKETKPALSMGLAVMFVTTMSSIITWVIYRYLLIPFGLTYLRTISFILVIAAFVQLVEMFIRKFAPPLYKFFGIYLPLITVNCAVLGVAVLNSDMFFVNNKAVAGSFSYSVFQGICVGIGYTLAMFLMSGIRERLELCNVPKSMKDFPLGFVIASLMGLAFMGFNGFKF
ncbi:MAG: Rnf-Nqr domain containing protein [Candidatus Omnitrophota bacterium]|jgi:electron transport complex protein RnfA